MRQIIVLDTNPADGGNITVNAACWFPVAAGAEVPVPSFTSAVVPALAGGNAVTASEQQALANGTLLEEVSSWKFPSTFTPAQIKAALAAAYATRAAYLQSLPNRVANYGLSFDGAVWSK